MTFNRFITRLFLVVLVTALLLGGLSFIPALAGHRHFTWFSLLIFVVLSIGIYFPFKSAAEGKNKSLFTQLSMVFIVVKMMLSLTILLVYNRFFQPGDRFFLIPFGIIYIVFTIFETWVLGVLGKVKKQVNGTGDSIF